MSSHASCLHGASGCCAAYAKEQLSIQARNGLQHMSAETQLPVLLPWPDLHARCEASWSAGGGAKGGAPTVHTLSADARARVPEDGNGAAAALATPRHGPGGGAPATPASALQRLSGARSGSAAQAGVRSGAAAANGAHGGGAGSAPQWSSDHRNMLYGQVHMAMSAAPLTSGVRAPVLVSRSGRKGALC